MLEFLVGILFPKGEELKDLLSKTYLPTKYYSDSWISTKKKLRTKYYSDSWKSQQRKSYQQIVTVIAKNLDKEKASARFPKKAEDLINKRDS